LRTPAAGSATSQQSAARQMQRSLGNQMALRMLHEKAGESSGSGSGSATTAVPAPHPAQQSPKPSAPSVTPATTQGQQVTQIGPVRASSTPPEMKADRIPPRVDTRVAMKLSGTQDPAFPVTLSVEGPGKGTGYGSVSFSGSSTLDLVATGDVTVKLRGEQQTDKGKGGQLKLVARQGGKTLAVSSGFSVAAIPQNHSFTFNEKSMMMTGAYRGIRVAESWESDSLNRQDLDQAAIAERVEHNIKGARPQVPKTSCYLRADKVSEDKNALVTAEIKGALTDIVNQTHMFRDDRTGAANIPMKNSGYIIEHIVQKTGDGFEVVTSKKGAAVTARDPNKNCKSGPIHSEAGDGAATPRAQKV
jgi:hypothetical protein